MSDSIFNVKDEKGAIVWLPLTKVLSHPANPRKDLGDLTELADSIKAKGIFQNLTVVKNIDEASGEWIDGTYVCVIGHRRKAAAKLAGLTEVPCVIADMTPAEQVQTMLLENMQRSDLTAFEQAQGFQMMIDFGDSVDSIAEKTGFSTTTVRRRLKMAELDAKKLKEVSSRQISITDFDRLAQIEDIKVRNKVLSDIGTNNFENSFARAIHEQKTAADEKRWREALAERGVVEIPAKDKWNSKYKNIGGIQTSFDTAEMDKTLVGDGPFYFCIEYGYCYLRKDNIITEPDDPARLERAKREEEQRIRRDSLKEACARAFTLRHDFVVNLTEAKAKESLAELIHFMPRLLCGINPDFDVEMFADLMNAEISDESDNEIYDDLKVYAEKRPNYAFLACVYTLTEDDESQGWHYWDCIYRHNTRLELIYELLAIFGYEMSDEERLLMNGKHELYVRRDPEPSTEKAEDDSTPESDALEDDADPAEQPTDEEIVDKLKEVYGVDE